MASLIISSQIMDSWTAALEGVRSPLLIQCNSSTILLKIISTCLSSRGQMTLSSIISTPQMILAWHPLILWPMLSIIQLTYRMEGTLQRSTMARTSHTLLHTTSNPRATTSRLRLSLVSQIIITTALLRTRSRQHGTRRSHPIR